MSFSKLETLLLCMKIGMVPQRTAHVAGRG